MSLFGTAFACLLLVSARSANASVVSADTLAVGTIAGQPNSNGITFSSDVFLTSGSSLTLQGSGGVLLSGSSITASAFFGDGGQLSNIASLVANQTFTGAVTFTSSVTAQTGGFQIILSTSASVNNISISVAGALTFSPTLHNSSHTTIPQYTSTNAQFGPCVTGSTITITTTGGRVELFFTGDTFAGVSFLQDGFFVNDLSSTVGIFQTSSESKFGSPFQYLLSAPSAGQHSYCITLQPFGAASSMLRNGVVNSPYNDAVTNIFYVEEVK